MGKKYSNSGEIVKIFKESVLQVAKVLNKPPCLVRRDEYCSTATQLGISRLSKDYLVEIGGYKAALKLFFSNTVQLEENETMGEDNKENLEKDTIIDLFTSYVKENKSIPTFKDLKHLLESNDISGVKKYFETINELFGESVERYPEIKQSIFNEYDFTEEYYKNVLEQIKKYKRFIVTTAVSGKKVHERFYSCLKNYAERNNALILVLPCQDTFSRFRNVMEWELDPALKECLVIFKDTDINNNLFISDIKVSAKMLLPLTGIARLSRNKKSMILSAPKQFLEFVPTSNSKMPVAIMSPGSCTVNDYSTDRYMSLRTSKLAELDHEIAGIVVEIEDEEIFHFRQVQYLGDKIIDLNTEYYPDGSIETTKNTVCVFGDSHCIEKENKVHEELKNLVDYANVKDIILHDLFDGVCINPHTVGKPIIRALDYLNQQSSIEQEGKEIANYLNEIGTWIDGEVVVVYANHNTFLQRYLEEGRFIQDRENCYYSLDLAKALIEGKDPLQYMMEEKIGLSDEVTVRWLGVDEDYKKFGVQLASHGHMGAGGSKGNARNIDKCFESSIIGHSHVPCIYRSVFQVGTLSKLRLSYNKGPSAWVNNLALLHTNGSRQLINFIPNSYNVIKWKI